MKQVTVTLAYGATDFGRRRGPEAGLALPVKALDEEGSVLAVGAASISEPAKLEVPDTVNVVFLRLTWPSSRSETKRVDLRGKSQASATFSDAHISPNEWSAWAIPKLNPKTPLAKARGDVDLGLHRFENVWLRLWKSAPEGWVEQRLQPSATYRNGAAWQLDLSLDNSSWLLQMGGSKVTWRFVSLPGGGPARVLITPKDSNDPRTDELKVVVTSFRADAETLLEFLVRDAMRAVDALAGSAALAKQLFADKFEDPISAVAGAYYLLRADAWQRIPRRWFENLSQAFGWLPDAAVVHCIRLLREGPDAKDSRFRPEDLFAQSLDRGWPVYVEGIALLQEAASSLRGEFARHNRTPFDQVQTLGAAKAWAGAAASFYGRSPAEPSALQWVGMPRAPRRKRLDPALMASPPEDGRSSASLDFAEVPAARDLPQASAASAKRVTKRVIEATDTGEFLLGSITR